MLLHDFVYIAAPVAAVRMRLTGGSSDWLSPVALAARGEGDALRLRIGPFASVPALGKAVRVTCGEAAQRGDVTVVPMNWQGDGLRVAFPVLDGDLEVVALGRDRTQVSFLGRYQPPFGAVGRRLDELLLHRVVQATLRSFLRRLARALEQEAGAPQPRPPAS